LVPIYNRPIYNNFEIVCFTVIFLIHICQTCFVAKMPWKEATLGRYIRQLDNAEQLLKTIATPFQELNHEHWAINFVASVQLDTKGMGETISALKPAWIALHYHHPHIAAVLLEDSSITYQVPDEEHLRSWFSESFFVHKDQNVEEYLFAASWMQYSSLHYFPDSSELVMRTHHWLVDGIGALHIANRFFELLASGNDSPTFGNEWTNLPLSLQEANGFSSEISPAGQEEATKMFMDFARNMPSIGFTTKISRDFRWNAPLNARVHTYRLRYTPCCMPRNWTECHSCCTRSHHCCNTRDATGISSCKELYHICLF
jgi:hypothetical protein